MGGKYHRPRMLVTLAVPIAGSRAARTQQADTAGTVDIQIRPLRLRVESNDHNHADTCSIECDWTEAGVDPRLLDNAVATVFIDDADESGFWTPDVDNCRFIGLVRDIEAERSVDSAPRVKLDCVDFTSLFLDAKPFGSSGVPDYTQDLDAAWRRIVSQTPGAAVLADRLARDGVEAFPQLGSAVAERFRSTKGRVPTHPETDAWAVWQQCVGMMGLISYIRLDQCLVTTARNLYTERDPPVLVWGRNIKSWKETRHSGLAHKGVALTSYDPVSRTTIEAFHPPIGDAKVKHKRAAAKKVKTQGQMLGREDREYFSFAGVTDQAVLARIAERVYEERSRQELEGRVVTSDMWTETASDSVFDLLGLKAGDSVQVTIDPRDRQLLANLPTDGARVRYLKTRGYSEEVATLIVANMADYGTLESKFFCKSVSTEIEVGEDGGTVDVDIEYVNRIDISGGTDNA